MTETPSYQPSFEKQKNTPPTTQKVWLEAFSAVMKRSQDVARSVTKGGEFPDSLVASMNLIDKQNGERQALLDTYTAVKTDTLSKSAEARGELLTDKARKLLYESFGIDADLSKNSGAKKFMKGLVDGAILGNMEFVESIVRDPMKAIEALKGLCSLEWLENALKAIGKSIYDLVSGDPYDTGKSIGELGLAGTGAGVAFGVVKKGAKFAMKTGMKDTAKEAVVHSREAVLRNAELSASERVLKAEEILGRQLSEKERSAILTAHETGNGSVYAYPKNELRAKAEVLKDEWFTKGERKELMESGVTGKTQKPVEKVEKKDIPPDTTAVPKYADKKPHEVNNVLKWEIEKITEYGENNLARILENAGSANTIELSRLNARGNAWVRAKIGNLNNIAEYIQNAERAWLSQADLVSAKNYLKPKIRDEALLPLVQMIDTLSEEGKFVLVKSNISRLERLNKKINAISEIKVK